MPFLKQEEQYGFVQDHVILRTRHLRYEFIIWNL